MYESGSEVEYDANESKKPEQKQQAAAQVPQPEESDDEFGERAPKDFKPPL